MQIPKLRQWREFRALTQEELAEKAGVSVRSVAGYEAGAGARPSTVRKLASVLEIEVSELFEDTYSPKAHTPLPENWAPSFPDEGFRRAVKGASSEELAHAMKRHVGNRPAQSLEDYRQNKRGAMATGTERASVFAHALIVHEELLERGEEPPEDYLPDFRQYLQALGIAQGQAQ